ncbi:MAG: hypothetical protein JO056_05585 [Alphaproteobacteria bacterium]|nr:hypothetical protein [Alphaproteobacteria bacterium]
MTDTSAEGAQAKYTGGLDAIERALWIALLLLVPISSSPLLPFGQGTLVRPLAVVPAVLLVLMAALRIVVLGQMPALKRGGFLLLCLFGFYVLFSGLAEIAFLPDRAFKGQTPLGSFLRAVATLDVGIVFYTVARLQLRTPADAKAALRYLFIGMTASIALAVVQVFAMTQHGQMLRDVQAITDIFAVHYDGLVSRAQGMTFEPSWLATQIIVLLLPALLAASLSGQALFNARSRTATWLLLFAGFAVALAGLLSSGSRFGLGCAAAMLVISGFLALWRGRVIALGAFLLVLLVGVGALLAMSTFRAGAGATYVLGPVIYLTQSAELPRDQSEMATDVADALALGGRISAAQAALGMWRDNPLFGLSLGNSYRYFGKYAPDWAFQTQLFTQGAREGIGWLDTFSPEKGNAKNLVLRLLSETGLVGFFLFFLFIVKQIFAGKTDDDFHRYFRLSTLLALGFAFLNQDSLADPVLWIPIALCFAMNASLRTTPRCASIEPRTE